MGCRNINKGKNVFLYIIGESLDFLERRLGVFGPFSFKLVLGLVLGLASLFLFAKLSEDLLFHELAVFDHTVTGMVRIFASPRLTLTMKYISWFGSTTVLITVGLVVMLYTGAVRKHVWDTVLIPITLVGGIILNEGLKRLFHRQRPGLPHLVEVSGYSFPSGHSMMSFIFYGLVIYLLWLNFRGRLARAALTVVLTLVILAVGVSRIYLGVHYPSDVAAGFAAGNFWLVACILGLRGIRYYKDDR